MIAKIINLFNIGVPNLVYISPGLSQEFSQHIITNLGYFWHEKKEVNYFRVRGKRRRIYNFDDPVEFEEAANAPEIDE